MNVRNLNTSIATSLMYVFVFTLVFHLFIASLTLCGSTMESREAAAASVMSSTGALLIPPYNYPFVMAGQGTIGLELLQQIENLDCIIVPVSGAGMISGITIAAKSMNPNIKIVAAEPLGTNNGADIFESVQSGVLMDSMPPPDTIADGLKARMGTLTWPVVRDMVDKVITVSEVRKKHSHWIRLDSIRFDSTAMHLIELHIHIYIYIYDAAQWSTFYLYGVPLDLYILARMA